MRLFGIRGATCTENNIEDIKKNVGLMCSEIFKENNLSPSDIVSIQFTVTDDLTECNPAAALRRSGIEFDVSSCALFCSLEPKMKNSLPKAIRVLVTAYMDEARKPVHIYRNGAEILRPDFAKH